MAGPVSSGMGGAWQGIWAEPHEGHYVPPTQPRMVHMAWGQRHSARAQGMLGLNWGLWGPHPVPWKELPAGPSIHPGPAEVAPRPGEALAASEPGQPAWDSQAPG